MTKAQLNNLISFCFTFHSCLGFERVSRTNRDLQSASPHYIIEKWDRYIGLNVKNIKGDFDIDKDIDYKNFIDDYFAKWSIVCMPNNIKPILRFIEAINLKPFKSDLMYDDIWSPSELLIEFEKYIGDPNKITRQSYINLSNKTKCDIYKWLSYPEISKDYQIQLII